MTDDGFADGDLLTASRPSERKVPQLVKLFRLMQKEGASDLHVKAGRPPMLRLAGSIRPLKMEPLDADQAEKFIRELFTPEQADVLDNAGSVDFAYEFGERERVRVNAFRQRGTLSLAARLVQNRIPSFDELNLPPAVARVATYPQGLVLVCGVTGSGKSTTLAAIIQKINETRRCHVLTIEDPSRFAKSRSVGAYLGLRPRVDQSGKSDRQLPISKSGDVFLRRLLVTSAHYILGPFGQDCDLRRKGEELAARGGKNAKKRAVVAVARKLAVLLHRLWVTGEVYEPLGYGKRELAAVGVSG